VVRDARWSLLLAAGAALLAAPLTIGFVLAPTSAAAFPFPVPAAFFNGFVSGMHAVAQGPARSSPRSADSALRGPLRAEWGRRRL